MTRHTRRQRDGGRYWQPRLYVTEEWLNQWRDTVGAFPRQLNEGDVSKLAMATLMHKIQLARELGALDTVVKDLVEKYT